MEAGDGRYFSDRVYAGVPGRLRPGPARPALFGTGRGQYPLFDAELGAAHFQGKIHDSRSDIVRGIRHDGVDAAFIRRAP